MANVIVLDTETTDLTKCFCYDCSWVVMDTDTGDLLDIKANVVEQVWHNLPLFESAYYKEKRQKYVMMMRKHDAQMNKWGYIMQELKRDIKKYNVTAVYAYNSEFDDKVISYNCDWYKCQNPLDNIPVLDIWGYASQFITNKPEYKAFCEKYERFTDTGNYKGSAEVVYQFLTGDSEFIEEHMGVFDSEIEAAILYACVDQFDAEWGKEYKVNKILNRATVIPFKVKVDGEVIYEGEYVKKYVRNNTYAFTTPE